MCIWSILYRYSCLHFALFREVHYKLEEAKTTAGETRNRKLHTWRQPGALINPNNRPSPFVVYSKGLIGLTYVKVYELIYVNPGSPNETLKCFTHCFTKVFQSLHSDELCKPRRKRTIPKCSTPLFQDVNTLSRELILNFTLHFTSFAYTYGSASHLYILSRGPILFPVFPHIYKDLPRIV